MNANRSVAWALAPCVVSALLSGPWSARADGFRNPPPSASGLGSVGARYALVEDVTASAYNPANLMEIKGPAFEFSLTAVLSDKDITSEGVIKTEVEEEWYLLPNIYAAQPIGDGRAVAGLAITTPFGQATEFDQDSYFRYTAPYLAEMRAVNVGPVLAYRVNEKLDVAAGLNVMWSDLTLRQVYPWGLVLEDPSVPDGRAEFEGDGIGVGGSAALTWRPATGHRVGLSYRSALDVDYEGDFRFSGIPAPGLALPRSDFDSTIKFPNIVGLGYGVDVTERLSLGVDLEWIEWSRYQELALDAGENSALLQPTVIPQDWDDAWNAGLGGVYKLDENWSARFGYIFLQTPVPDQTLLPALPENDQHVVSVGLNFSRNGHRVNFAYAVGLYEDRDIDNNLNPAYNGKYEFISHIASLSYGIEL